MPFAILVLHVVPWQHEFNEQLSLMHTDLGVIEDLHIRYTSYQYSYCKLVVDLARRRRYVEGAAKIVQTMTAQLDAMAGGRRPLFENARPALSD